MKKTLSIVSLILIVLGLSLIVIGYQTGKTEAEIPSGIEDYEQPDQPVPPSNGDADGNADGDADGDGGAIKPKRLNIFGIQLSELEVIGFVLIGCGVVFLFVKR